MKKIASFTLPVLGGAILTLSFAPFKLSLLAWISFIPLFYSLKNDKYPFIKGFLMGLSFYALHLYWIPFSNVEKSIVPQMTAGYFLLLIYLSSYFGFSALIYKKLKKNYLLYLFPAVFAALEFLRGQSSVWSFPWGSLGYSQTNLTDFVQIAKIGGITLVTFWIIMINILIYLIIKSFLSKNKTGLMYPAVLTITIILPFLYSKITEKNIKKNCKTIKVCVLQPDLLPEKKRNWSLEKRKKLIGGSIKSTGSSDLCVLPETAYPHSIRKSTRAEQFFSSLAKTSCSFIVSGMPDYIIEGREIKHFNAAAVIDSSGIKGIYRKNYLVPFVERLPFDDVIPALKKINLGQGHFSPGKDYSVIDTPHGKLSIFICYEAIYPQLIRKFVRNGAGLLINITEDSWFGKTWAPYQHAQMAVFRSIEFNRFLVRSANTGVSLISNSRGEILEKTDIFKQDKITKTISIIKEKTIYTKIGDSAGWLFVLITFVIILYRKRKK